ncbi:MAG: hypothetical protein U9N73_02160 [Candidatus Auribacterota bacterium]|nr:hypothetical protein [Candidatus Auribacterota bacterium]
MSPPTKEKDMKYTPDQIQDMLDGMDWDQFWQKVIKRVDKDVTAYERARAKSRAVAGQRVLL